MENATKRIGMASGSTHWEKAGMTQEEWKKAVKFDSTDWGWVIMSIGMAIGSGIVFLPVQVGLVGLWVFLGLARRSVKIMPVSSVAIWEKTGDSSWGLFTSS